MTAVSYPKPQRAPKEPWRLKRKTPLRAKHWGVSRGPLKTKHARRPREWGFMSFCHARGCELALDTDTQRLLDIAHVCSGPIEFAHLSDRKRYDVGDIGACLCRAAHRGIDGRVGGKAAWYASLGRDGQRMIRMRLANRARAAWEALPPVHREAFEELAALQRKNAAEVRRRT